VNGVSKIAWPENLTILSIYDNELLNVTIHPRPVKGLLIIENRQSASIYAVNIFNALGKLVLEGKENFNKIDVSQLASGLLFLKLETAQGILTKKVIKE
jgi:hypothetical protein|tara:strand:- start:624 stop:920 length:297 start_codon:yes stop_codon:yes gene_type:complete